MTSFKRLRLATRIFSALLFLCCFSAAAQHKSDAFDEFVQCVENQYGTNNYLANGRLYNPKNTRAKGFPYFKQDDWLSGIIYFNGSAYPETKMKYNLEGQQLILKKELINGTVVQIIMNDNIVDSFSIDKHLFVNISLVLEEKEKGVFLEKIYTGSCELFQLHKKLFDAVYSTTKPYGQYSDASPGFYVVEKGNVKKITKESAFLSYFGSWKSGIKTYMDQNQIVWKKASNAQMVRLMKFIDDAS